MLTLNDIATITHKCETETCFDFTFPEFAHKPPQRTAAFSFLAILPSMMRRNFCSERQTLCNFLPPHA